MYCNSILKKIYIYIYIYFIPFLSHHLWLSHSLNSVLIVSLSFSLSLSSLLMLFASIGVSWVKWWIGMVGCGLWVLDLGWSGRFSGYFLGWLCGFDVFWVDQCIMASRVKLRSMCLRHFFLYFIGWSCGFDVFWVFSGLIGVSWVKLRSMWLQRFSGLIISVFLGIFDGLGFKLTAWVSDRWLYWWFVFSGLGSIDGFWSVALMIGGMGLMVCVCVALLMVWWFVFMCGFVGFVFVCVCVCVCVWEGGGALCVWWWVWIDLSVYHRSMCVTLCVEPELKVKGEREAIRKPRKIWQSCLVWKKVTVRNK